MPRPLKNSKSTQNLNLQVQRPKMCTLAWRERDLAPADGLCLAMFGMLLMFAGTLHVKGDSITGTPEALTGLSGCLGSAETPRGFLDFESSVYSFGQHNSSRGSHGPAGSPSSLARNVEILLVPPTC